jgi:hypothetical protein
MRPLVIHWGALLLMPLSLCGCAAAFDAYQGPRKPDSELAIVHESFWNALGLISIGMNGRLMWTKGYPGSARGIKLEPGVYDIEYGHECVSDYAVLSGGSPTFYRSRRSDRLDVVAGHIYVVHSSFSCSFGPFHSWIEDETTHQVVAGTSH